MSTRRRCVARERVQRADDRRGHARPAEHLPPAVRAVVDPHARARIGDRGHVGHGAARATGVGLPRGLGLVRAAPAARARPHRLGRVARAGRGRLVEARAADRDDVRRRRGIAHAVAVVAGARDDRDAGVVEVVVGERSRSRTRSRRSCCSRRRRRSSTARFTATPRFDSEFEFASTSRMSQRGQSALTICTSSVVSCAHDAFAAGYVGAAVLVDLAEAAVRRRARGQAEARAVHREVGGDVRRVVRVDDRHRLPVAVRRRRRVVRRLQERGVVRALVAEHVVVHGNARGIRDRMQRLHVVVEHVGADVRRRTGRSRAAVSAEQTFTSTSPWLPRCM